MRPCPTQCINQVGDSSHWGGYRPKVTLVDLSVDTQLPIEWRSSTYVNHFFEQFKDNLKLLIKLYNCPSQNLWQDTKHRTQFPINYHEKHGQRREQYIH
jgi:hypothetical protein